MTAKPGKQDLHRGSSRIIVKNVPKHCDDARLRKHFSEKGRVTDAVIVKTKEGQSRLFGFVGFATEDQAAAAVKHFNRTYLDTSKLEVALARPKGDAQIARPWSKHSEGSSKHSKLHGKKRARAGEDAGGDGREPQLGGKAKSKKKTPKNQGDLDEFVEMMKPRSDARLWANDDALLEAAGSEEGGVQQRKKAKKGKKSKSKATGEGAGQASALIQAPAYSLAYLAPSLVAEETVPAVGVVDAIAVGGKKRARAGGKSKGGYDSDKGEQPNWFGTREGGAFSEASDSSDDDELPSRASSGKRKAPESAASFDSSGEDSEAEQEQGQEQELGGEARLFVRNLSLACSEDDLKALFEPYGEVCSVHVPVDDLQRPKGFGFVQFAKPEEAAQATQALDNHAFQGRLLHILAARPQPAGREQLGTAAVATYKAKQEAQRKAKAGEVVGWNASYVRSDTVVDSMADRLGIAKGQVLDVEEGDMAVRLALGETALVAENKAYLEQEGVNIGALDGVSKKGGKAAERSTTVILAKNLAYTASAEELAKMFGAFGEVTRVVLPPSRAVALVEFLGAADARRAFKRLAYRRCQNVPLYLEWAPTKVFNEDHKPKQEVAAGSQAKAAEAEEEEGVGASGEVTADAHTVFVKNLAFATTEAALRKCFSGAGAIRGVHIPKKKKQVSGKATDLSMGYGFVEFDKPEGAEEAIKSLQGHLLAGHKLEVKKSTKRLSAPAPSNDPAVAKRSKMIVRNVAFQATAKEIRELFSKFGQLKKVRMPKKFDGSHRGFAFVEFLTPQEALSAYTALASTHLYGRHLVLEWAEDTEVCGGAPSSTKGLSRGGCTSISLIFTLPPPGPSHTPSK
ncbi:unnamed protein product [Chrysoparadoxa australica]